VKNTTLCKKSILINYRNPQHHLIKRGEYIIIITMDKELYSTIEHLIIKWNLDGYKTAGHLTRQIMEHISNVTLNTYKTLEENGVYIHYAPEHYSDGSNLSFSIEFTKQKIQTGWYNDDHEFGDAYDTKVSSIKLAQWYLEDPKRIELIDGSMRDPEYTKYVNDLFDFLETIVLLKDSFTPLRIIP
jgi:hypothetical protein